MMRSTALLFVTCVCAFASQIQASETNSKPIGEAALLSLDGYYACLDVQLRGDKSYPFILDTGASSTLLLNDFAKAQGFRVLQKHRVSSVGKIARAPIYDLGEISVGGARWPDVSAIGIPLKRLPCAPGIDAVGALGMDFLAKPVLEFDFPARRVRIYQPKRFHYQGSGVEISYQLQGGSSPVVPVHLTGLDGREHTMRLLFDTGAPATDAILISSAAELLGLPNSLHIKTMSGGANGERHATSQSRIPWLRIGSGKQLRVPDALIAVDAVERGALSLRNGNSGLLGLNWAKQHRIWLDGPRLRLIVEAGHDAVRPASTYSINSRLDFDAQGTLRVAECFLANSGPECDPGLFVGDEILSVNDVAAPVKLSAEAEQLRFWQPFSERTELRIQIRRPDKTLTLAFQPRDLLEAAP